MYILSCLTLLENLTFVCSAQLYNWHCPVLQIALSVCSSQILIHYKNVTQKLHLSVPSSETIPSLFLSIFMFILWNPEEKEIVFITRQIGEISWNFLSYQ